MVSNFFVYVLQRPIAGEFVYGSHVFRFEPFYVGKGYSNGNYDRLKHSLKSGNKHKINVIKKYDRIEISLFPVSDEKEAIAFEKTLISAIGRSDLNKGPLTNKTDGGEGMSGSLALCKRVAQYSRDGSLMRVFDSMKDAFEITKVGNISRACSSGMLAGEFFWKKIEDSAPSKIDTSGYFLNRMHDGNKPRPVLVHSIDSTQRFESIKSASEHTGIYSSTIIRGCKNLKVYDGFRFEYENK